jgi:hypothetical protein
LSREKFPPSCRLATRDGKAFCIERARDGRIGENIALDGKHFVSDGDKVRGDRSRFVGDSNPIRREGDDIVID